MTSAQRSNAVSYCFAELRRECREMLLDSAARDVDDVLLGCCRQIPMLLYHPETVVEYTHRAGLDPLTIDVTDGEIREHCIRWRADFFTQQALDLRQQRPEVVRQQDRNYGEYSFPSVKESCYGQGIYRK